MYKAARLLRPLPHDRPGEVLDEVERFFDGGGRGEAYLWSAWPTPDLRPRGWVLEGHPPMLLRTPGGGPGPPGPPRPPGARGGRGGAPRPPGGGGGAGRGARGRGGGGGGDGSPSGAPQPSPPGALVEEPVLADGRLRLW